MTDKGQSRQAALALHARGVAALQAGDGARAVQLLGEAVAADGAIAALHANHGLALHAVGDVAGAEAAYRRALALDDRLPSARNSLGTALQDQGRFAAAEAAFRAALELDPDYLEAAINLGGALHALKRPKEAEEVLRPALARAPDDVSALITLAAALKESGRAEEAEELLLKALRHEPGEPQALVNLALVREKQGRWAAAEALYRQAWAQAPGAPLVAWNLGLLLLRQGRLTEGWPLYEARFAAEPDPLAAAPPLPLWRGEPLNGRALLVWREQGLGDDLLFGSVLPQLAALIGESGRLIVAAEPRLVGLFARALPGVKVAAARRGRAPALGADLHCPMGSLPGLLRPRLADWPVAREAWLTADAGRLAAWRERLAGLGPGLKIGVAWRSGVATGERAEAYLQLADLAPLAAVPGVLLVNLQYDLSPEEASRAIDELGAPLAFWSDVDLRHDLEGAAALTAACDLVVSVASSVGEMAGALGVPTWRVGGRDWTMLGTNARPWFPAMRPWAPPPGESLRDVIPRLAAALRNSQAAEDFDGVMMEAERLRAQGRGADAEGAYQKALALRPGDPRAGAGYARLAREAGRPDLAAAILGGVACDGDAAQELALALSGWAAMLAEAGEVERAAKAWWALIVADPGGDAGFAGLANLRAGQDRHPQALRGWERAIKADPTCAEWRYNQGNSFKKLGRFAEADAAYLAAARCKPDLALADFNRGYAALEQGRIAEGWDGLEKRFAAGQAKPDRRFNCPQWRGEALTGGDLLIWREQGVGDELMFATCYADAIARARAAGAHRVWIDAEPRLAPLLARRFGEVAVVRAWRDGDPPPPNLAAHIPAGSLPALLRRALAAFSGDQRPVIAPDPAAAARWRGYLAGLGPGLKVGISWRSGLGGADRFASFSSLVDDWGGLLRVPGVCFVNLQYDDCAAELDAAERRFGVVIHRPPGLDQRNDLEGVAALISVLDLAIATGTSVAELAGALGVPLWRLCQPGEWSALGASARPWFPSVRPMFPTLFGHDGMQGCVQTAARELARFRPAEKLATPAALPPPSGKPADLLARGVELHRAGRLTDAAAHYRAVPTGKPQYADARHLLGMIAYAQGRPADALADFDAAIAANGRAADFHANRALALHALERFDEAAAAARRALKLNAGHAEAANTLGNALAGLSRWEEAAAAYRAALKSRASYAEAGANLGVALFALNRRDEAAALLRPAIGAAPNHAPARGAWADLQSQNGDAARALTEYRKLLALQPSHGAAWEAAGRMAARLDPTDLTEPLRCWRRALRVAPTLAEPWRHVGDAHRRGNSAEAAALAFKAALALRPDGAGDLSNLAMARQSAGDPAAACRLFARALRVDPADGLARFNRSLMRLADGDAVGGWADYDGRLAAPSLFLQPGLPYPFWRGEDLAGRHVVVWREQGLGDELMFAALYPLLIRRAARVTLACDPRLVGLFARSFPQARVRALADFARTPDRDVDCQVAAGSLARLLAPRLGDFPLSPGWLRADPGRAATWREKLAALGPGLKLGVAWTSRRLDVGRARAYLPLADLAPMLTAPGVVPISLQYDGRFDEIDALAASRGVKVATFPDADLKNDLETAAALTAACDLVLSVASSVGEMASAAGVPVWRLGGPDWTWLGSNVRPWHPGMRTWAPRAGETLAAAAARAAASLRCLMGDVQ